MFSYQMNNNLARPFVLSLVLIDLVLHITLLLAFRSDVSVYLILAGGNSTGMSCRSDTT